MKRQRRVDDLVRAIGDIDHGDGLCNDACQACDIVDQLAEALVTFETDEALDRGADLVDVEPIA